MTAVLIIAIVMTFSLIIAKLGMDHDARMKLGRMNANPENSLKVSELQEMIRSAVEEAQQPLEERLALLEERMERQEKLLAPPAKRLELEEGNA